MIKLACGNDFRKLGLLNFEGGVNISAFLDHLEICDECRRAERFIMEELNRVIGDKSDS